MVSHLTALKAAALHACGLLRLAAGAGPEARAHVFAGDSPVWGMFAEAEANLFNAAGALSVSGEAEGRDAA